MIRMVEELLHKTKKDYMSAYDDYDIFLLKKEFLWEFFDRLSWKPDHNCYCQVTPIYQLLHIGAFRVLYLYMFKKRATLSVNTL